jgi:hypothetical protein
LQRVVIKDRLSNYKAYNGYKIEFNTQYDESNQILIIGLIITISDLVLTDEKKEILVESHFNIMIR